MSMFEPIQKKDTRVANKQRKGIERKDVIESKRRAAFMSTYYAKQFGA